MEMLGNLLEKATNVALAIVYSLVVGLICSIPLMLVWNWIVPAIFGLTAINLIQAFGLSVLTELLFTPYSTSTGNSKQ